MSDVLIRSSSDELLIRCHFQRSAEAFTENWYEHKRRLFVVSSQRQTTKVQKESSYLLGTSAATPRRIPCQETPQLWRGCLDEARVTTDPVRRGATRSAGRRTRRKARTRWGRLCYCRWAPPSSFDQFPCESTSPWTICRTPRTRTRATTPPTDSTSILILIPFESQKKGKKIRSTISKIHLSNHRGNLVYHGRLRLYAENL